MSGKSRRLRVLFLEPFCGGSHRLFAETVVSLSRHRVETLTLPGSFWKWRLRGAHLSLLKQVRERLGGFDALLSSGMLSLAELVGVVPQLAAVPKIVYLHENQIGYPAAPGSRPDVHFGFTNLSTALAADRLVFNSRFHRQAFLEGITRFLAPMPDHRPTGIARELRPKCSVIHPGVDCEELERHRHRPDRERRPRTILWNHRWEFDKQPEVFFKALRELADEGLAFRVHVLGENFQVQPKPFLEARRLLGERLATFGRLPRREDYIRALWDSDIVVSTAIQEFFGIAVMEAVYCGARPLLPRRLVYPELYPASCLYEDDAQFKDELRALLAAGTEPCAEGGGDANRSRLRAKYDTRGGVRSLDQLIEEAVLESRRPGFSSCLALIP